MGTTAQSDADGDPGGIDVVPAVGTIVTALAMGCLLVPVRQGVDEPTVLGASAFAIIAVVAFLARRHGVLERQQSGLVAAASSALVVILSATAIMLGTSGSIILPEVGWSISLLFGAFVTSFAAAGVAIADYASVSGAGLSRRTGHFLEMVILGLAGLVAMQVASVVVSIPMMVAVGELTEFQWQFVSYLATGLGLGTVAFGYLAVRDYSLSYIDIKAPTLQTVVWMVVGLFLIFGANIAVSVLMTGAGVESAEHSLSETVEQNIGLVVIIIPAMILIVGPFEELLYRNVVQKSLYGTFSRPSAIVVASTVFAVVHVGAYATAGAGEVLASLASVFALSLVLGTIYERTDNLVVPALVHGCYNALLFVPYLLS
ncbi:abortive phage infection protein [Halostagnicola larsenii XH-48]|uniref:Abortive phage infection protein n=1 Tax=Halostagnicola larsenii XH-48 TaxID=797299 RepID=W0JK29_9EURY|nr:type II CAAX endopeptidase family protein [Halostagnicola larsenii]AHF98948.1 abortive phage infection protein [Halostagnicola larsenii XH-48]